MRTLQRFPKSGHTKRQRHAIPPDPPPHALRVSPTIHLALQKNSINNVQDEKDKRTTACCERCKAQSFTGAFTGLFPCRAGQAHTAHNAHLRLRQLEAHEDKGRRRPTSPTPNTDVSQHFYYQSIAHSSSSSSSSKEAGLHWATSQMHPRERELLHRQNQPISLSRAIVVAIKKFLRRDSVKSRCCCTFYKPSPPTRPPARPRAPLTPPTHHTTPHRAGSTHGQSRAHWPPKSQETV